jgi:two-component system cell cycle response regulator
LEKQIVQQQILAIDDSPDIHQLLTVRLGGLNVDLRHALTGESGYEQACAEPPDLILLDVMMPDASGFEICRRLKTKSETASIPVIFLTGETDVEQKVLGFDVGAVDYIQKPFDTAELTARVRSALRTKRYFDMLAHRAMLDGLTGLWNRSQFDQRLYEEIACAQRYDRPLSLIMMDVDRFKDLNDRYGHPFGDQVLQSIGELLQSWTRSIDLPCRYGGEEFGIILRETDLDGAERTAERIRLALVELTIQHRREVVPVTASFGVSAMSLCLNLCELDHNWLISHADSALYDAKNAGRNCVRRGVAQ